MLEMSSLKPSIVLSAMVVGLLKSKDDPNFVVKMETFGKVKNNLCYGCCATLTLAEMFGKGKSASELMLGYAKTRFNHANSAYLPDTHLSDVIALEPSSTQDSFSIDELYDLEQAVDSVRAGDVSPLIEFLTGEFNTSFDRRWFLTNQDWEAQLPEVKKTIAEMAAAGY